MEREANELINMKMDQGGQNRWDGYCSKEDIGAMGVRSERFVRHRKAEMCWSSNNMRRTHEA